MNLNIFSDLRKLGLVPGKSLSLSTNINSVPEKNPIYTYNLCSGNHTEITNIQKKTVLQYSYSDAFLFRHQTICSS